MVSVTGHPDTSLIVLEGGLDVDAVPLMVDTGELALSVEVVRPPVARQDPLEAVLPSPGVDQEAVTSRRSDQHRPASQVPLGDEGLGVARDLVADLGDAEACLQNPYLVPSGMMTCSSSPRLE